MVKAQGAVSIVMPCYNKEHYIATMLDTVIAQTWDNIELVLVNDGSTDGTRDIIVEYEPKLKARGYQVTIVDQENVGVCAAAKVGLAHAAGDYICMVDSDDELDPQYVSTMAAWLDENPDCEIVICSGINFRETEKGREFWHLPSTKRPSDDDEISAEHFIIGEIIRTTVWVYMVRAEYLNRCRVVQTYFTDTRGSHEPGYVIPILAYGGKIKYFPVALYNFNGSGEGHSQFKSTEHARQFYDEYHRLCVYAINALPDVVADSSYKCFLRRTSLLSKDIHLYRVALLLRVDEPTKKAFAVQLLDTINKVFGVNPPIAMGRVWGKEMPLISIAENCVFGRESAEGLQLYPELRYAGLRRRDDDGSCS
jgi:glycosyltransferase involved in cell wall biosynthesis